jgi:hypothetical protein
MPEMQENKMRVACQICLVGRPLKLNEKFFVERMIVHVIDILIFIGIPSNHGLTMSDYLSKLPVEVILHILLLFKIEDLKFARLINRRLSNLTTPLLFTTVGVVYTEQSIRRLTTISKHPVLRNYITTIYYEADRLDDYNYDAWLKWASSEEYSWREWAEYSHVDYQKYRSLVEEQTVSICALSKHHAKVNSVLPNRGLICGTSPEPS